ncbi:MAG: hypothetical protein ABIK08_17995, partial [Pseudomonadota bacterium]
MGDRKRKTPLNAAFQLADKLRLFPKTGFCFCGFRFKRTDTPIEATIRHRDLASGSYTATT